MLQELQISPAAGMKYLFEEFELDTEKLELTRSGEPVRLEPQVLALIELLVSNAERAVSKDEINERVWGGRIVTDAAVNSRIRSARQALDDSGSTQRLIRTVRNHGFRFVGEVRTPTVAQAVSIAAPPTTSTADEGKGAPRIPAIAVLPLQLLSLDTRYEPLADAIAHEIIADLSRLRWLHVISRASTFKLRGREGELDEVARLLGVDYALTGTLALFGERASISIELTDCRSGGVVWAENIESSLDELIELRVQVVTRIANAIELRIQSQEAETSQQIATENLDAWMSYFRGLRHVNRFNAHDNEIAMHLFERAVALDPQFALAHAGLSFAHFQNAFVRYVKDTKASRQAALATAEKAFELDQLDPVVNLMMGRAKYLLGQWEQAEPWFDRCTTLNPNSALAYYNKALVHTMSGESADIPQLTDQALSLSPIDPLQYAFLAVRSIGHLADGELDAALHWGEQAANAPLAHHLIDLVAGVCNYHVGNMEQATFRFERARQRSPQFTREDYFRSLPTEDVRYANAVNAAFDAFGWQ